MDNLAELIKKTIEDGLEIRFFADPVRKFYSVRVVEFSGKELRSHETAIEPRHVQSANYSLDYAFCQAIENDVANLKAGMKPPPNPNQFEVSGNPHKS